MNAPVISEATFDTFFGYLPWVIGLLVLLTTYLMVRGSLNKSTPIGQTFACAECGRRAHRDHMVPATHEGAVAWYCGTCSHSH